MNDRGLFNQRGSSLLGPMLGILVAAGSMAAIADIGNSSLQLQKATADSSEFDRIEFLLKSLYLQPEQCQANFEGLFLDTKKLDIVQVPTDVGGEPHPITQLSGKHLRNLVKLGESLGGVKVQTISVTLFRRTSSEVVTGMVEVAGKGPRKMKIPINFALKEGVGSSPISSCSSNLSFGIAVGDCGEGNYLQGVNENGSLICKLLE